VVTRVGKLVSILILIASFATDARGEDLIGAGVLTVASPRSARMDFTLDTALEILTVGTESEQVRIEGTGPAYGMVVVDRVPSEEARVLFLVAADHVCRPSACGEETLLTSTFVTSVGYRQPGPNDGPQTHRLDPGDYTLFLIGSRSPVSVQLALGGSGPERRWVPTTPAEISWPALDSSTPLDAASMHPLWWASATASFEGAAGVAFSILTIDTDTVSVATKRRCTFQGRPSPQTWLNPMCPDGTLPVSQEGWLGAGGSHSALYGGTVPRAPGEWTTAYRVEHIPGWMDARARGFSLDPYAEAR